MSRPVDTVDVLYLTHNYPRYSGDYAGRFVARLAELVASKSGRVGVLAPHDQGAALEETVAGVHVRRFRYAHDLQETLAYRGDLGRLALWGRRGIMSHWRFVHSFLHDARNLVQTQKPRVVHAHWWIPAGWVARRLDYSGRLIVTLHGTDLRLLMTKRWLRRSAARVFDRAEVVTVVSSWLANRLRDVFPQFDAKIHVVPMPPNDDLFNRIAPRCGSQGETPLILSVTRFTRQKRNTLLVRAAAELRHAGLDFRLRLIGEGPLRQDIESLVAHLALQDRVEFRDPISQVKLVDEYRCADVVVLPAVDEGFGMALVEAQLCGTAVVGARSGGLTDIIVDGHTGLLARPDDVGDLAAMLKRVLLDHDLRRTLADAGRVSAGEKFSSTAIVDRFCHWYDAT